MIERPEGVTRERVAARLKTIERLREIWRGNPSYLTTLDVDLYALRLALKEVEQNEPSGNDQRPGPH